MTRKLFIFLLLAPLLFSCGQNRQTHSLSESQRDFLDNLSSVCGKSFRGSETYSAPGRESWADREFVIHVTVCTRDSVYVRFHIDQDRSRTWMFLAEDGRLRFRHDHRHGDGTPEELTMYGGYSDGTGTGYKQYFPADDYTVRLLDDTLGREWRVYLAEDLSTMTYELHYSGKLMFSAEFDLANPV
jgi:hypothetical protein